MMKHPYFKKLFLLLGLFLSATAFSQVEIKSKVADFQTFMPIESASVYVQNSTIGTVSNIDGKFALFIPKKYQNDTLIVSSIGYKNYKIPVQEFDYTSDVYLEEDIASLDEVVIVANPRPKTGNDIVLRAIEELEDNLPDQPYMQKGFLRHKERNKKEYKWLIESALTLYDSRYASGAQDNLKINVDEVRKSYDLRDVDSLFSYASYLKYNSKASRNGKKRFNAAKLRRDTIKTASLIKAIKWSDTRVNGLTNLFTGRLNLLRNANVRGALFGEKMLEKHQFELDTILVDNGRKLYKIRIAESTDYVGLNTENIYNEGYQANGWLYIYYDNYAVKKIEYELVAASEAQRRRSKSLFDTKVNHKLVMSYMEYQGKMYPSYLYYETPKLVKVGNRSSERDKTPEQLRKEREEQFYLTVQEILFSEVIVDSAAIDNALQREWSADIFSPRPYNKSFWKNYNVLLESEEDEKLIQDLTKRATLFKQ